MKNSSRVTEEHIFKSEKIKPVFVTTMPKLNPKHVTELITRINKVPYFELLSMKVTRIEERFAEVYMEMEEKHLNPFSGAHGGVYCSLIDTAAYWAVYSETGEDDGYTSLDINVDFLSTITKGKILAKAKAIKTGRRICVSEVSLMDENGKLLAHGTAKLMIVSNMTAVNHSVETCDDMLPPKFLL